MYLFPIEATMLLILFICMTAAMWLVWEDIQASKLAKDYQDKNEMFKESLRMHSRLFGRGSKIL